VTGTRRLTEDERFANLALGRVMDIETGFDDIEFQDRTVRVSIVYMKQDLALLCFGVKRARDHLKEIRNLLTVALILGVLTLVHWW
jgi:hypothetical protein